MTDLTTTHLKHLLDQAAPGPWEESNMYPDGAPRPGTHTKLASPY
ncbi:hypothetical protein ACLI1R_000667 [Corynebacterium sp. LaCa97]|nr:MAG TPA: hypothetical protein [Caudoviricetes sp.]